MNSKIPDDAFEIYVGMGPGRSYHALAEKLGVDKRSIVRRAGKEDWAARLSKIQEGVRAAADRKVSSDLQAVRERQLLQARYLQGQALKAIKDLSPKDAVKIAAALNIGWKHELLLLGEPTDRQASTVEEITKREIETLLLRDGESEDWEPLEQEAAAMAGDLALSPPPKEQPPSQRPSLRPPAIPPRAVADPPWKSKREFTLDEIISDPEPE